MFLAKSTNNRAKRRKTAAQAGATEDNLTTGTVLKIDFERVLAVQSARYQRFGYRRTDKRLTGLKPAQNTRDSKARAASAGKRGEGAPAGGRSPTGAARGREPGAGGCRGGGGGRVAARGRSKSKTRVFVTARGARKQVARNPRGQAFARPLRRPCRRGAENLPNKCLVTNSQDFSETFYSVFFFRKKRNGLCGRYIGLCVHKGKHGWKRHGKQRAHPVGKTA